MYRIIVADDEEELRRAIIRKIQWEEIGFQVVGEAGKWGRGAGAGRKAGTGFPQRPTSRCLYIRSGTGQADSGSSLPDCILSGYDDFSHAQQAIQYNIISYMLKPISMVELTEELKKIKEKLDHPRPETADVNESLMPLLLAGYQEDRRETGGQLEAFLAEKAEECGLLSKGGDAMQYVVMTTAVLTPDGKNCTGPEHVYSVDSILKKYLRYASFFAGDSIVSLLIGTQARFDKYLHIAAENITQSMERILSLDACVGVSRVTDRLLDCHRAFREAEDAMSYARNSKSRIHFIFDEEPYRAGELERVKILEKGLVQLFRSGTQQELTGYLEQERIQSGRVASNRIQIQGLSAELYSQVGRMLTAVSGEEKARQAKEAYEVCRQKLDRAPEEELWQALEEFCLCSWGLIAEQRKKSSQVLCEKAIQIMEEHYYDTSLSLSQVSSMIGVSPNYLAH